MRLNKNILYSLIILVLCFISYSNILANDFVWDDEKFIVDQPGTRTLSRTLSSFSIEEYGIYRPVRSIFYYFAYRIFGLNPILYHFFSIILHASISIIVFFIIKKLFDSKLALLSAMLFAVHPIHIGRVTNATGSFDIIGLVLYLLSFYLYVLSRDKKDKKLFYTSLILFIIGIFTSEEIFTLPILILFYEFIFNKKGIKKYFNSAYYFISLALFLFFRFFILKIVSRVSDYPGGSLLVTFLTMPKVLLQYLLLTFLPFGLTPFRRVDFVYEIFKPWFILPIIFFIFCFYLIYKYRKNKAILFFSGWSLITMVLFLNIMPLQKIMAERYFYLASFGIIGLISLFFIYLEKKLKSKLIYSIFALLIIFFSILTLYNNTFWEDDFTLMTRGITLNPYSSKAHDNLGVCYYRNNDFDKALIHFRNAVNIDSEDYTAWDNLGSIYSRTEQYGKAIESLEKSLKIKPYNYQAYDRLGIVYMKMENNEQAEEMFKTSIYFEENYYPAYSHLGTLYGNMGNYTLAAQYLQKALTINPSYAEAYFNLGLLLDAIGKDREAIKYYKRAAELSPENQQYSEKLR
ncbi:MAG: tetratricopeptide repeat protein [Nanoarchaeota archaeon]|nr:tetratricopeptide repeat protein [Nanoarchaeota archaeon]